MDVAARSERVRQCPEIRLRLLITLVKFLFVGMWLAASVVLGTNGVAHHHTLKTLCAIVVGLPGALVLAWNIRGLTGQSDDVRQRVRRILQSAIVRLAENGLAASELMGVSMHVWVVPPWYRVLVPYQLRRRVSRRFKRRLPPWLKRRPALQCVARFRVQPHDPTGLTFRPGIGLVGRCVAHNQAGQIHIVKLSTAKFRAAAANDARWKAASVTTTQNLDRESAMTLARSYSEAGALVIKDASGDALGCVTLEVPVDSALHLPQPNKKVAKADLLIQQLRITADLVQNQLRHGGD